MKVKRILAITCLIMSTAMTSIAANEVNSNMAGGITMKVSDSDMVTTSGKVVPKQTAGRKILGEFAPTFAHLNDDVLFGEVWSRDLELPAKQRSIITITALVSQGLTGDALKAHLRMGKQNGITKDEIAEILTHMAFYAGWPKVWATFPIAQEVWSDQ